MAGGRTGLTFERELSLAAPVPAGCEEVLSRDALTFVDRLVTEFGPRVDALLAARRTAQARRDKGDLPTFLPTTACVREASWSVWPPPPELLDRRVEITAPVDRKMIIHAMSSGARVFMADFEDSLAPTWANVVHGQRNLIDAVNGTIRWDDEATGKSYALGERRAALFVRPRGWHLFERHVQQGGRPVPAALFDLGLFVHHNGKTLASSNRGPYFYLPKLEGHLEARLWNDILVWLEHELGLSRGTMKATVLIETLPAAFEMDEILYEMREHSVGLNLGRWDYIFSVIKTLSTDPDRLLPDREELHMGQPFLRAVSRLLVRTCHRRGAHAIGGMAAQVPSRSDPVASTAALRKVEEDKLREVRDGFDGTWVAHPDLVPLARRAFDFADPNQVHAAPDAQPVRPVDLLALPSGGRTEGGLRRDLDVCLRYLAAWLRGQGCIPLHGRMEDAATAEISRALVWQWVRHRARLDDGRVVTAELVTRLLGELADAARAELGAERYEAGRFREARRLLQHVCLDVELTEFLTLPAYAMLED
jgi:malate synthase